MEIKDYNGKLCSFKFYGHKYVNILIKIGEDHVDLVYKTECIDNISHRELEHLINDNLFGYEDFKLNNNTMENLSIYDGKSCSFNYMDRTYQNILIKINNDNVDLIHSHGQKFTTVKFDKFIGLLTSSGRFGTYSNFKITEVAIDSNMKIEDYHKRRCSFNYNGIRCENVLIKRELTTGVVFISESVENFWRKSIETGQFEKIISGKDDVFTDFKLTEETTKNKAMKDLSIYDGKLCKFNYRGNLYLNILIKITDNHVDFINADGVKFMELSFDLFTMIVNKHPNFSIIEDFKITEDKSELKTVRDYYNKYNAKLCCFNNGNGTKKYRINVSLYNDSVYLNSNLNEIKYDESLCRKIDIHTFDYLLKNGKLLNKVITDFRLLESEKRKISMKEISEKFNIHVNDIEIIK